MKKVLSALLVLTLVLVCVVILPTPAKAATQNGFVYTVADGEATITEYTGSNVITTIPTTLGGYPVTTIGRGAFNWSNCVANLTIPEGVTTIGEHAFTWSSLRTITIPASVTTIGDEAFSCASLLARITVDENNPNYSTDESGVLFNKNKTTLIHMPGYRQGHYSIPNGVTVIEDGAFYLSLMNSVSIPNSVVEIGAESFALSALTSVMIPDSVKTIGSHAFDYCTNLKSVMIGNGVTTIGQYAFEDCEELTTVTMGNTVTAIGSSAFSGCKKLAAVTIPESMTNIYSHAFAGCTSLNDVYYGGSSNRWNTINIDQGNAYLTSAPFIHFAKNNPANGWNLENGNWYYYKNDERQTGWLKDGGYWYFMNQEGIMQTGWILYGKTWYYLYPSGNMATGWANVGGVYYCFDGSGHMKTGWLKDGGLWYFLQSSGAMKTGWMQSGSKWYYFRPSGAMAVGWANVDGVYYYFDANGYMKTGWISDSGKWYYMNSSGAMVTGWKQIGSTWYYFNNFGAMHTGWLYLSNTRPVNWYDAFCAVMDGGLTYEYYDVDGNGIPELLASDGSTAGGVQMFVYHNGTVNRYWIGEYCGFYDNGIIIGVGGRMGYYYDKVYKLENGVLKDVGSGNYEEVISNGELVGYTYKWNGQIVTESEYNAKLLAYGETSRMTFGVGDGTRFGPFLIELRELYQSKTWEEVYSCWYYLKSSGAMVTGSMKIGNKTYNFSGSGVCLNP